MNQFKYDIFVSYSRQDFDEVNAMVSRIKEAIPWLNIWFDITGIESGDEFQEKIIAAIDSSSIVLFALSDNSINHSKWTQKEVVYAKNTSKRIVPILLKGSKLKGWFLFQFGTVDCIDIYNDLQWDKLLRNLSEWFPNQSTVKETSKGNSSSVVSHKSKDLDDLCALGDKYYNEENYSEAIKWYREPAEQGYAEAQCKLGNCYSYSENYSEAIKWYRKAAEQGYARAQQNIGICYDKGEGVPKNCSEAVKWYRKAAEQGYANSQYTLGYCYYKGEGVTKDYSEAVKWYLKAAELGNAGAQNNLGNCYNNGEGVVKDYTEAAKWYRKAAENGEKHAQYNLGNCYFQGEGVPKDYTEAIKWYRRAAESGHEQAIEELKKLGEL